MEDLFREFAAAVALTLEAMAVLLIATGGLLATYRTLRSLGSPLVRKREAWIHFAAWLVLGLEFALAADIVRTAISPGWTQIGQLGAIAGIRTFLNYFLEKDLDKYAEASKPAESGVRLRTAA